MSQIIDRPPRKYRISEFGFPEFVFLALVGAMFIFLAWKPAATALHTFGAHT